MALTTIVMLSCSWLERQEVTYADRGEAEAAGAISRGWIPAWIPKSARGLREVHDLDTNQSMLAFHYSPFERPDLEGRCQQIGSEELPRVPFSMSWWPSDIPTTTTPAYVSYSCIADRAFLAVLPDRGEAYYWRP